MIGETFLIVVGTVLVVGIVFEFCAVIMAPLGYQDETGFHPASRPRTKRAAGVGRTQTGRP
ncbi:MAG: hypothetical protein JWR69_2603 [Pedosphaera sp.]|nr:hypothetical protein [Pedosphaera sp.]